MNKIPLIILHGWNLNKDRFSPLVRVLKSKGYAVFCPDLPGFGKEKIPVKPLQLNDYVEFVVSFMEKHRMKKADFICHSFGGRIGIKLAVAVPSRINRLILTGVPGLVPVPRFKVLFYYYLAKAGRIFFSLPLISIFQEAAQKFLYRAARATDYYNTSPQMRETFQSVIRENLKDLLPQISSNTLLLWGKNDRIVPDNIAVKMKNLIPASELRIIHKTAHGFPFSHPRIFVRNLEDFLKNTHV